MSALGLERYGYVISRSTTLEILSSIYVKVTSHLFDIFFISVQQYRQIGEGIIKIEWRPIYRLERKCPVKRSSQVSLSLPVLPHSRENDQCHTAELRLQANHVDHGVNGECGSSWQVIEFMFGGSAGIFQIMRL